MSPYLSPPLAVDFGPGPEETAEGALMDGEFASLRLSLPTPQPRTWPEVGASGTQTVAEGAEKQAHRLEERFSGTESGPGQKSAARGTDREANSSSSCAPLHHHLRAGPEAASNSEQRRKANFLSSSAPLRHLLRARPVVGDSVARGAVT